jgi:hypothetical protein
MTQYTANVLSISWAGEIAGKLAGKILNVLVMYWVGMEQVLRPFPCSVFAVYLPGTPVLAPSDLGVTVSQRRGGRPLFNMESEGPILSTMGTRRPVGRTGPGTMIGGCVLDEDECP